MRGFKWTVLAWVALGTSCGSCIPVAECGVDSDCKTAGQTCDTKEGKCVTPDGGTVAGSSSTSRAGSSGVSAGSTSGVASSGASLSGSSGVSAGSSSSSPQSSSDRVDAGPDCPGRCGTAVSGNVATWTCENGGGTLAACRVASCAADFRNCADAGAACETNVTTDTANCGSCGTPVLPTVGNACVDGHPMCGAATCITGTTCTYAAADAGPPLCCAAGETNCGTACANLMTDSTNCGTCGTSITTNRGANSCTNGGPSCGTAPACDAVSPTPYCVGTGSAGVCQQCETDGDCTTGKLCCAVTCKSPQESCGCSLTEATPGASCSAGDVGGQCLVTAGGVSMVAAGDMAYLAHMGSCGCAVPGLVTDVAVCSLSGGFNGLCGGAMGDVAAKCITQGSPTRNGTEGAQNCGAVGNTCDPSKGGLNCVLVPDAGVAVGACACNSDSPIGVQDGCRTPVLGADGRMHEVARVCQLGGGPAGDRCQCGGGAPCSPNSPTPDCAINTCTNLATDPMNCGAVAAGCKSGQTCGTTNPGQCGCGSSMDCPVGGGGGGRTCGAGNVCVCADARIGSDPRACGPGETCSDMNSLGCCEWGVNVRPNSCVPTVAGIPCAAPDAPNPNRRVCYPVAGAASCCDKGCAPDGTCKMN